MDFGGDLRDAAAKAINPTTAIEPQAERPPHLRDKSHWPKSLFPLLDRYGVAAVWEAGLLVCGHPPTWGVEGKAYERLCEALEREASQTN